MDGLVVPMMRQWTYHQAPGRAAITVWVYAMSQSRLVPVARNYDGFVPLETVVVGTNSFQQEHREVRRLRPARLPVSGQSYFVDDAENVWFVNEVAHTALRNYRDQLEVSLTRYGLAQGLGYDIPSSRTAAFGPPSGWTLVDAAGVPVQVMRVDETFDVRPTTTNVLTEYSRFTTLDVAGDTGTYTAGVLFPAQHARRGARNRSGFITSAEGRAGTGFLFVFENGNPYTSRAAAFIGSPSNLAGQVLSMDDGVVVGDYIIMQPA